MDPTFEYQMVPLGPGQFSPETLTSPLGVVHKLQTLVIRNMLKMGESRDMSRIHIALQGYTQGK